MAICSRWKETIAEFVVEQANGVVAIMTDYNNRNIVVEKGIKVVVMIAIIAG